MTQYAVISGEFLDNMLALVRKLDESITLFVENDLKLRRTQAGNSPLAIGFQQGTIVDTAITRFDAAQTGAQKFSYIEVLIEDTAGSCRYTLDASDPSAAGRGHKIPAGGSTLTIPGDENIKNFKIVAETGNTAAFTMQGFF
jgi:hypothetical protein